MRVEKKPLTSIGRGCRMVQGGKVMTQETKELLVRALRRAAEAWDDAPPLCSDEARSTGRRQAERDACFVRGFAEALENGCNL